MSVGGSDLSVAQDNAAYWLASYPRSGNTLVRIALSRILLPDGEQLRLDQNFPEYTPQSVRPISGHQFGTGGHGGILFVKTHWRELPEAEGLGLAGGVYLCRHPVDVFLSGMNYLYINSSNTQFRNYFFDKVPRSVEDLAQSGLLDRYLDRFVEESGLSAFNLIAGTWVDNIRNWHAASEKSGIRMLRYEDLIRDLEGCVARIFADLSMSVSSERIGTGIRGAQAATRADGGFFWRASSNTRANFFSEGRVSAVANEMRSRLGDAWSALGYS